MQTSTATRLPTFFDPKNAGDWNYNPNIPAVFDEAAQWRADRALKPAATDRKKIHALLIDVQKDFCFREGTLYVGGLSGTGAIDDSHRMAAWIYQNIEYITEINPTLDTHVAFQIFSRSFWENADGTPIAAHTVISANDVRQGVYKPSMAAAMIVANGNYQWLLKQAIHYCEELERAGKYQLYIWPEHCLLGSAGHTLVGVITEAMLFHAYARGSQPNIQIKGGNPLTENYSVLRPEVLSRFDGAALAQRNTGFLQTLLAADAVVIAGQAASHCVKSTIDDLLDEIAAHDASLAKKVYLVTDCMSAVTVPDGKNGFAVDFTPQADQGLAKFANAGMHLVRSTDPIASWPGIKL